MAGLRYYIPPAFLLRKGGPEGIRTLGHLVKSQMLYLAELQAQGRATVPLIIIYYTLYQVTLERLTRNITSPINIFTSILSAVFSFFCRAKILIDVPNTSHK